MANTTTENKVFDNSLCLKDRKKNNDSLNSKITDLTDELFDANNMIYHYKLALAQVESRLVEYKEREVKYIEIIRTLEFYDEDCADDTVTDYSRPSPTVESFSKEDQNRNHSASENVASPITPKQFVKFVKASNSQSKKNFPLVAQKVPLDMGMKGKAINPSAAVPRIILMTKDIGTVAALGT
nr:hypothetical protein [Tanacetum cinerariifolium]